MEAQADISVTVVVCILLDKYNRNISLETASRLCRPRWQNDVAGKAILCRSRRWVLTL